jgi:hypothetical protein
MSPRLPYFTTLRLGAILALLQPAITGVAVPMDERIAAFTKTPDLVAFWITIGARYAVGSMTGEATMGRFGGMAVFHRAITDVEMKALHTAAGVESLK